MILGNDLLDADPTIDPTTVTPKVEFPHHPWVKQNAKVTLFHNDLMPKPQQGRLVKEDDHLYFLKGRSSNSNKLLLTDFSECLNSLVDNKKLFHGWRQARSVITA
eukprot:12775022-Ditylum_brightwellii.AAC.1